MDMQFIGILRILPFLIFASGNEIPQDVLALIEPGMGLEILEFGRVAVNPRAYLSWFNFRGAEQQKKVGVLSGGERNRLHLAKLLKEGGNLMLLDEPTNDLDVETLDLLEELLLNYAGTVLVVSHDRAFLDNVVTGTFVFEGDAIVKEYVGGYSDWLRQRQDLVPAGPRSKERKTARKPSERGGDRAAPEDRPRRLTYLERQELAGLSGRIETLEAEKQEILEGMAQPEFYTRARSVVDEAARRLASLEEELSTAYGRWEELEERSG